MEKYVKILQDLKNKWELNAFGDMVNVLSLDEIEAIENILKEIKRLKVYDNAEYQKYLYGNIQQNYISKSKIYSEIAKLEASEGLEDDMIAQYLKRLLKERNE